MSYNKLKKIVNEIKYSDIIKVNLKESGSNLDKDIANECLKYVEKIRNEDIDLQDLLLALNKLDYIDVKFGKIDESVLIIEDTRKIEKADVCEIVLSKPLSNQKEEVYNKLIEILK